MRLVLTKNEHRLEWLTGSMRSKIFQCLWQ